MPGLLYTETEERAPEEATAQWIMGRVLEQVPFLNYLDQENAYETAVESSTTYDKIVAENSGFLEAKILEENQEAGPVGEGEEDAPQAAEAEETQETEDTSASGIQERAPVTDIPLEKFQDYDYVINNFFVIDKTTTINSEQLNAPDLVQKDLRMQTGNDKPQILIYHSHSQEDFADSVPGDTSTTVVGVGEYLTDLLSQKYDYNVIHVTDVFDMVDGKLDRNKAYNYAGDKIQQVLEENPSIEVVIDLHRDGIAEGKKLVTDVNGKPTAQIMFFNGLSRTTKNGDIPSLPNPYIQDNLALSLQLSLEAKKYYPDFTRCIYLKGYRYNLHMRPKSLLVECGAQTNTVAEVKNAMEPLADILNKVLKGE
ncbi:stage II sporulation protein P [Lactonifactor sp. BIOML-A3]|nr:MULTISPECIES: stage II sporulation protein P [unclassified Lactonifactor]MSA10704.1 stage II sporulation protein P [Lactonifactor sp. BIOML-A4]MSA15213.1 stage II sporulation protein P [Lactonifactor sp. BIOML-A3]MSB16112.1 stage II sporulation protein P [Lactonifactor sp. BIOML-A6]MSB71608.1 stage II sporulation protein P [Lactonifactor sp. BIOML-A7]MSA03785.1 stage II sporulation protein P [Lactonifactor sp. BIOML-A5]